MAHTDIAISLKARRVGRSDQDWKDRAACRPQEGASLHHLFFNPPYDEARMICATCPVRIDCLEWALEVGIEDGMWGGLIEVDRKRYRRRQQKAARKDLS